MKYKLIVFMLITFMKVSAQTVHTLVRNGYVVTDTISADDVWGLKDSLDANIKWSKVSGKPTTFNPTIHQHLVGQVTDLQDSLNTRQKTLLGTEAVFVSWDKNSADDFSGTWNDLTGKPLSFTPSVHSHTIAEVTGLQAGLDGKEPVITAGTTTQYWRGDKTFQVLDKTVVGLSNVDNTTDLNKPVSTATQTALNSKQNTLLGTETVFNTWDKDASNDFSGVYSALTGIPTTFTPSTHSHSVSDVTGLQGQLDGKFSNPVGTTSQYIRGDGTLATTPTGESTTVTDSPIVDFTLTGTAITATIVDGSITPAKLSQTYLTSEEDASTTNELQTISQVGNTVTLSNGGGSVTTTDNQDLTLTGNILAVTNDASTVDLGMYLDNTDGQSLSISGTTLSISGGSSASFAGWDFNVADDFNGAWASLTGVPAGFADGTDNGIVTETDPTVTEALVDGFVANNGYLTSEVDASITNEIQNLSLAGQALSITGATGVTLPVVGITAGAGIVSTPTSGNYAISQVLEQRAITTTTQASTVVTATNITGLGLPIVAGKKYQFEAWLPYSSAANTTGIALAHTAVTGNTWHTVSAKSTTTATQERRFLNSSTLFVATSSAATTGNVAYMQGRIEPTANTTFQLQFATEIAGNAITLQPGCILIVKEVF